VLETGSPTTSTSFRNGIPNRIGPARSPGMMNLSRINASAAGGAAGGGAAFGAAGSVFFGAAGSVFFGVAQAANDSSSAAARMQGNRLMISTT